MLYYPPANPNDAVVVLLPNVKPVEEAVDDVGNEKFGVDAPNKDGFEVCVLSPLPPNENPPTKIFKEKMFKFIL